MTFECIDRNSFCRTSSFRKVFAAQSLRNRLSYGRFFSHHHNSTRTFYVISRWTHCIIFSRNLVIAGPITRRCCILFMRRNFIFIVKVILFVVPFKFIFIEVVIFFLLFYFMIHRVLLVRENFIRFVKYPIRELSFLWLFLLIHIKNPRYCIIVLIFFNVRLLICISVSLFTFSYFIPSFYVTFSICSYVASALLVFLVL